jgi:hypothetical protein
MDEENTITINIGSGSTEDVIVIPAGSTMGDVFVNGHGDTFTVDLNNRAGATTSIWASDSITIDDASIWSRKEPDVELSFNEDPLAIVLALMDQGQQPYQIYESMIVKSELYKSLDVSSFIPKATEIRDYYRAKLITSALSGTPQTEFRKALGTIIKEEKYTVKHLPILIRLPSFYEEDHIVEDLISSATTASKPEYPTKIQFIEDLEFVKKFDFIRRTQKSHKYVFKNGLNNLYVLSVSTSNELTVILDYVLRSKNKLTLSGTRAYNQFHGHRFGYYEMSKIQIKD